MTTVTLVYPYFHPSGDNSIFRFPPLGLGYIAAHLKAHGVSTLIVDCTFSDEQEALEAIRRSQPRIIGIQVMFSMKEKALEFAKLLLEKAQVAVSPGIGFGPLGEGHVRFALVENEHRIRQATRAIGQFLK